MDNIFTKMLFFVLQPTNEIEKSMIDRQKWLNIWYGVLSNIMTGIFTYTGIEPQIVKRINYAFFHSAYVCAYEDENTGIIVAPCEPVGEINDWGEYSSYNVVLPDGKRKNINKEDCVIGYNYYLPSICDSLMCYQFAESLSELKLSIQNSIILSRVTSMIEVPNENALNEVLTKFNNYSIGTPLIVAKKREDENFQAFSITPPESVDKYYDGLRNVLNEFLTVTGLSSLVNPNKKERLLNNEISSNEDIKNTLLSNRIENREDFIRAVNEKFNTAWKVMIDERIFSMVDELYDKGVNSNDE